MLEEKIMVSDALNGINGCLTRLGEMISQTENQQLRQTLIQMRNSTETSQFELYSMAKSKSYYEPAQPARPEDIQQIKSMINKVESC